MKGFFTALSTFSRAERIGFAVLTTLLLLLVLTFATLRLWVRPVTISAEEQARLAATYRLWKAKEDGLYAVTSNPAEVGTNAKKQLFAFDPNTIDSSGLINLGMPPRAVKGLLNWRRKGKHFYRPEDLKPLYNLPAQMYAELEPYIQIAGEDAERAYSHGHSFPPVPTVIDLNSVDSSILDRGIPGIGGTLAHKIIQRRNALGGFVKPEQLLEVYKFPDTTFQRIKEKLQINPLVVRKIALNTATIAQLSSHPYVSERIANNIILYREGIKHYTSIEQLRQVPLMNEEIYRKIAPYFVVE